MPIIPSNWTSLSTVNAITSGGSSKPFKYVKTFTVNSDNLTDYQPLIGYCLEDINREFSVEIISGKIDFYWVNYNDELFIISQTELVSGDELKDTNLDCLGVSFRCYENSEFFVTLRWDTDTGFYIYEGDDLMIPVKTRLLLGTGANYTPRNLSDFDADSTQYLINLDKLKNSDSNTTGYKLFDIFTFYPGKPITFSVTVTNPANYGNIAVQLFDPINLGEALFDVASDVVNVELNNITDNFIGRLTKDAWYKDVINDQAIINPDFSRHVGRFVAVNLTTNKYDTAIIESYTPNADPLLGGTFTLTGEF